MPWKRLSNSVEGFPWPIHGQSGTLVEHDCSPAEARLIALKHPDEYNCFFICSDEKAPPVKLLKRNDAVFFSIDKDAARHFEKTAFDSTKRSDLYMKTGMTVVYYNPNRDIGNPKLKPLASVGDYVTNDGGAAIDVVCIFAANFLKEGATGDCMPLDVDDGERKKVKKHGTVVCGNKFVYELLKDQKTINDLRKKGITVLLSVLNHWVGGWSKFNSEEQDDPSEVARQLKRVVHEYKLGGIDIDDEYSDDRLKSFDNSLAMLTAKLRYEMPNFIITKALFQDKQYFNGDFYRGKDLDKTFKLGEQLAYGWEMSYWISAERSLPEYLKPGFMKSQKRLLKGFKIDDGGEKPSDKDDRPSTPPVDEVKWLKDNGYGGVMVFDFQFVTRHYLWVGWWNGGLVRGTGKDHSGNKRGFLVSLRLLSPRYHNSVLIVLCPCGL